MNQRSSIFKVPRAPWNRYIHDTETHNTRDAREIIPVLVEMFRPTSVVDVGCGLGTFLKVFKEHGVNDVSGIDGSWVDRSSVAIEPGEFLEADLEKPLNLGRRFDLVLCLEVAEHLPASASDTLVKSLVELGDIIIFSAAIPFQGGQNHINEQWIDYWRYKFNVLEYEFYDLLREKFWDNSNIFWWYKQNMVVAAPMEKRNEWRNKKILNLIHPEMLIMRSMLHDQYINEKVPLKEYLNLALKAFLVKAGLKKIS
jgi:SAM-dependent methyltransferase